MCRIPAPCPILRKEFEATGEIKSAKVYATGLGLYELRINGEKADGQLLTPGWTSYSNRLQYQTYDVTSKLKCGKNAVMVVLGDAQVFIRTASFNMNTAPFFEKWLRDLKAAQLENGGVLWVIPQVLKENEHLSFGWGDAAVICPWIIYLCFGDKRVLEEQYESMKSWVEYIRG